MLYWLLTAAIVLLVGMLIRRVFVGGGDRRRRNAAMANALTGDLTDGRNATAARDTVQASHAQADVLPDQQFSDALANVADHGPPAAATQVADTSAPNVAATAVSAAVGAGQGPVNRISSWNDRQLFTDFTGIIDRRPEAYRRLTPEELPIQNEDMLFGSLTPALAQMLPESENRRALQRKNLTAAGYRGRAAWTNLTALRFVLAFLALCIVGFWLVMAPPALETLMLSLVIIAPLLMWALPPLVVSRRAGERRIDIERGLPDVLDMLNMGISQGLTVPQTLSRVSSEIKDAHPALSEELWVVNRQAAVSSLPQALQNLRDRIDSPEVSAFSALLMQSELTGSSISNSLAEYSDSIRNSLRERADARANAASFKLLFPVSLCLMPSVFLFLLGPAVVQLTDYFQNQAPQLNQDRDDALNTLDNAPAPLDFGRFQQNQF